MNDILIRGLLFGGTVNVTAVSGAELTERARVLHGLSHVCTAAMGRLLMQTAMMSVQLKGSEESITVVLDGNGAGGRLVAVGREGGVVKGYVDVPDAELPLKENGKLDVAGVVGSEGEIRVIKDLNLKEPYVGRCNITDGEIANDFANYFVKSEQQPSLVYLGVRVDPTDGCVRAASGLLLQPLPNCPEQDISAMEAKLNEISGLTKRIELGESLTDALCGMFADMMFEITSESIPEFKCGCSRKKIEAALISMGREELTDIIEKDRKAELRCRFCNSVYQFDEQQLRQLLSEASGMESHEQG